MARSIYSRTAYKAAGIGFLTGLPANIALAAPAALLDAAKVFRMEVISASKVAMLYDPYFLDDDEAPWELLVPLFGIDAVSQFLRGFGEAGARQLSRFLIRKYLTKKTLKSFKMIMLKVFGKKVTQKIVLTKTVPIVGGLVGGTWNLVEVKVIGKRVIRYFEEEC